MLEDPIDGNYGRPRIFRLRVVWLVVAVPVLFVVTSFLASAYAPRFDPWSGGVVEYSEGTDWMMTVSAAFIATTFASIPATLALGPAPSILRRTDDGLVWHPVPLGPASARMTLALVMFLAFVVLFQFPTQSSASARFEGLAMWGVTGAIGLTALLVGTEVWAGWPFFHTVTLSRVGLRLEGAFDDSEWTWSEIEDVSHTPSSGFGRYRTPAKFYVWLRTGQRIQIPVVGTPDEHLQVVDQIASALRRS
ncbi:MAG: hypothetical protein AAF211_12120 [Myxococcota bacterium]